MDHRWLVANLATFPLEALREFERVLPGDIRKCREAKHFALAGKLSNVLDSTRQLIREHDVTVADAERLARLYPELVA